MRQMIKGLLAAFAVMTAGAAPAMACGYSPCATYSQAYVIPSWTYSPPFYGNGCGSCGNAGYIGGWGYQTLAEPTTQYYYVNQGPAYSGPGAYAPEPAYQEEAIPTYGYHHQYGYRHHYSPYGYHYGHSGFQPHHYAHRHWGNEGYYGGHPLVRRYY